MQTPLPRTLYVTEPDLVRLERVIAARREGSRRDEPHLEALAAELQRAEIVAASEVPPDVITMGSRALVRDLSSGAESVYTLVFPSEADLGAGRLSVLAPIGTALLGYRQGDVIQTVTVEEA